MNVDRQPNLRNGREERIRDVVGRAKAFEAIVKGTDIPASTIPESFKVLVKELQALGLSVTPTGVVTAKPQIQADDTTVPAKPADDAIKADLPEETVKKTAEELAKASGEETVTDNPNSEG